METGDREKTELQLCSFCNQPVSIETRFCNHCGTLQQNLDFEDAVRNQQRITSLAIFFGVHLFICLLSNFTKYTRGLVPLLIIDGVLSTFTLIYVVLYWGDLKQLLYWRHLAVSKMLSYAGMAIAGAVLVNWAVKWVNRTIFDTESYYYSAFSHLKYAKLVTILTVAVQPAIFEELAFRGVVQQGLNKVTGTRQAIFIAAFLFTILHMSFISFFWLMPFALWLGYVRMKEATLWYGILIHFCFNTTACFLEFFELNLF